MVSSQVLLLVMLLGQLHPIKELWHTTLVSQTWHGLEHAIVV